ncbi:MAG: Gfo/Idh/MocA family oxidoreductase [Acidobacteria bacterium]|nr:Gfo/Idh/MocA family oxidoreductase [Acidobacteriota bacterium]
MKRITPVLVGRGMAGRAIQKSLSIVSQTDPELELLPLRQAERNSPLSSYMSNETGNVLFLANPSALHAASILQGVAAGYNAIAAEKPVCVEPEDLDSLKGIDTYVSVYHGYRAMWGTRTIKGMIEAGDLGEVFSFESRYWQSSSAHKALKGILDNSWKNTPDLNGPFDALTDLGSHVVDICLYLMSDTPAQTQCRLSYRNAVAAHRDTHVHLCMDFPGNRHAMASISKTLHGASNDFEYTVVGSKGAATWKFMRPDEVEFGTGNVKKTILREAPDGSSGSVPFHGLGWLEGYVAITHQTLRHAAGLSTLPVPVLSEALAAMDVILYAEIKK